MNDRSTEKFRRRSGEMGVVEPKQVAERLTANLRFPKLAKVVLSPLPLPVNKNLWNNGSDGKCLNANLVWFDDVLFCHGYGMGAPNTVFFAEIWHALGASDIVFMGTAGAITDDFKFGEVAVVDRALRDEGVSYCYLDHDNAVWASEQLTSAVKKKFNNESKKITVWSTDAIFRETPSAIKHFREQGAQLVDMEISAFFALAEFRGFSGAAIAVVTDRLTDAGWEFPQLNLKPILSDVIRVIAE